MDLRTPGLSAPVALLLAGLLHAPAQAANPSEVAEAACSALLNQGSSGVVIQKAEFIAQQQAGTDAEAALTGAGSASTPLPPHCLVQGEIAPRTGSDGKHYGIGFELRMPVDWQQRLLFQGGGGLDGFLAPALGRVPVHESSAPPALARGYAVVSMDGGHRGLDAAFAHDQQARLDYAYAAIGKVTDQAKRLVERFYGATQPLKHAYFMGCSNGGREAMIAAQRYPTEFDGVVAGNPGFRLSRAAIGEVWDTQAFMSVAPKDAQGRPVLSQALTPADLNLVSQGVLKACDALDGVRDGLINNYPACHFDPQSLQCPTGVSSRPGSCLPADKVAVLKKVFGGAHNSRGDALYSTWPYDAGISADGWRAWKLGSSLDPAHPDARNVVLGGPSLREYFTTPPCPTMDLMRFSFDRDVAALDQTGALHDAVATDLNTFEARGGKIIVFQGLSDPVFSADDIMAWYRNVQRDTNGGDLTATQHWARLFMVPGMTHCGGGPAMNDFDPLIALQHWVEDGKSPADLPARGQSFPGRSQPLCPYPSVARYTGGDARTIGAYACQVPSTRHP